MYTLLQILGRHGEPITSVEEWFQFAPPQGGTKHWVDGRSAKELAKAWLRPGYAEVPLEFTQMLVANELTQGFSAVLGLPEHITRFDHFPGSGRHHDMLTILRRGDEMIVVGVEGKAGEDLGRRTVEEYDQALEKRRNGISTNVPDRILDLVQGLFGRSMGSDVHIGALRYQLLTASAGVLVEAHQRGAKAAILLVQDLIQQGSSSISATQMDLSDFVGSLGQTDALNAKMGHLYGPLPIPGGGMIPNKLPFFVGMIRASGP